MSDREHNQNELDVDSNGRILPPSYGCTYEEAKSLLGTDEWTSAMPRWIASREDDLVRREATAMLSDEEAASVRHHPVFESRLPKNKKAYVFPLWCIRPVYFVQWAISSGYRVGSKLWPVTTDIRRGWHPDTIVFREESRVPDNVAAMRFIRETNIIVPAFGEERRASEWIGDPRCGANSVFTILARLSRGMTNERAVSLVDRTAKKKRQVIAEYEPLVRNKTATEAQLVKYRIACKQGYGTREQLELALQNDVKPGRNWGKMTPEEFEAARRESYAAVDKMGHSRDEYWAEFYRMRDAEDIKRRAEKAEQDRKKAEEYSAYMKSQEDPNKPKPDIRTLFVDRTKKNPQSNV
jgi:hypothetical protein